MDVKYVLTEPTVSREIVTGGKVHSEDRNGKRFLTELGKRAPMDTGWLPPGVRRYSQAGDYAQVVIECPPEINRVYWGQSEGDPEVKTYLLAQPWRLIVADLVGGNLLGAKMFYSPVPFAHMDQPLYHANVPNLNCKGYGGGNAVGWLCLYHVDSWGPEVGLEKKVARIIERCSGSEAYNNNNMSETDGPRFYEAHNYPRYTWDPVAWEEKTEKEGTEWTLDSDLWIPVLVGGKDAQERHYDNGVPLTIDMAINGRYRAYYNDSYHPKPAIALRTEQEPQGLFIKTVQESFNHTPAGAESQVAQYNPAASVSPAELQEPDEEVLSCADCEENIFAGNESYSTHWGIICHSCAENTSTCENCNEFINEHDSHYLLNDNVYCENCADFPLCDDCGDGIDVNTEEYAHFPDQHSWYCEGCANAKGLNKFTCDVCGESHPNHAKSTLLKPGPEEFQYEICPGCFGSTAFCAGCSVLFNLHDVITTKYMEWMCEDCYTFCSKCSFPVGKTELSPQGMCTGCAQPELAPSQA